jgi:hypothetical protein
MILEGSITVVGGKTRRSFSRRIATPGKPEKHTETRRGSIETRETRKKT